MPTITLKSSIMAMCVKIAIVLYEFANEETASCVNYCWKIKQYYRSVFLLIKKPFFQVKFLEKRAPNYIENTITLTLSILHIYKNLHHAWPTLPVVCTTLAVSSKCKYRECLF